MYGYPQQVGGQQQQQLQAPPQQQHFQSAQRGLESVDAWGTHGLKAPGAGMAPGANQGTASYSNVPLSQIPTRPPEQYATAAPVMQRAVAMGPGAMQQLPPQAFMTANSGLYPTTAPVQQPGTYGAPQQQQQQQQVWQTVQSRPYTMPGQFNTMAGTATVGGYSAAASQPQQGVFVTQSGGGATGGTGPQRSLQAQQYGGGQAMPQQGQQAFGGVNPFGGGDPFVQRQSNAGLPPPAPSHFAPSAGGGPISANVSSVQSWDPFTSGQNPAGRAQPGTSWDPFSQQQQQAAPAQYGSYGQQQYHQPEQQAQPPAPLQHQQQQQQQQQQGGWADLSDAEIWGNDPKPKKAAQDDDANWSDDDAEAASDDGEPSSPRGKSQQVDHDFALALKLQREEEARAERASGFSGNAESGVGGGLFGGPRGSGNAPRNNAGDKPDGECLARISVRTLLVKKWKPTYYIFELPDLLLLYRSRDDYLYNPKGTMIKKRIELKYNHTLTQLKRKVYKDSGYLWHFTLEEQLDYGPSVVAKFAHHEKRPLEEIGNRIAEAIREKRRLRSRFNAGGGYGDSYGQPRGGATGGDENTYGRRSEYATAARGQSSARSNTGGSDKYSKWGTIS